MGSIYIESKPAALNGLHGKDHLYLVYKDDQGQEKVIRGGPTIKPAGNPIDLEINELLEKTDDKRGTKKVRTGYKRGPKGVLVPVYKEVPVTPQDRGQVELDLKGKSAEQVWKDMIKVAEAIEAAGLDYHLVPPNQNSNSVIRTILEITSVTLVLPSNTNADNVPGWKTNLFNLGDGFLSQAGRSLGNALYDLFNKAKAVDPLALDLNGDGLINTVGTDKGILFDHNGDGIKTGTGWLQGGSNSDGLLVWDKNGNGKIDNGTELFGVDFVKANGNKATSGFDALADLDTNKDGIFDNKDNKFNKIKVWQDKNQDGISQTAELKTLSHYGIKSIKLNAQANRVNLNNGNVQTDESVFNYLKKDGTTSTNKIANLGLASNPFRRWFSHKIALSDAVKKLPAMQGSGMVRDLSEAMMLSPALLNLVKQYTQAATYQSQRSLLNQLISAWGKTATMQTSLDKAKANGFKLVYMLPGQNKSHFNKGATLTSSEQALMTKQQKLVNIIALLEKFNGTTLVNVQGNQVTISTGQIINAQQGEVAVSLAQQQITLLEQSYQALQDAMYQGLLSQTRLKPYLNQIEIVVSKQGDVSLDLTKLDALLTSNYTKNKAHALADLIELNRYHQSLVGQGWTGLTLLNTWLTANQQDPAIQNILNDLNVIHANNASIDGTDKDNFIVGNILNNIIKGNQGDDVMYGLAGNDTLKGNDGDDTLYGNEGNDTLYGNDGHLSNQLHLNSVSDNVPLYTKVWRLTA